MGLVSSDQKLHTDKEVQCKIPRTEKKCDLVEHAGKTGKEQTNNNKKKTTRICSLGQQDAEADGNATITLVTVISAVKVRVI